LRSIEGFFASNLVTRFNLISIKCFLEYRIKMIDFKKSHHIIENSSLKIMQRLIQFHLNFFQQLLKVEYN